MQRMRRTPCRDCGVPLKHVAASSHPSPYWAKFEFNEAARALLGGELEDQVTKFSVLSWVLASLSAVMAGCGPGAGTYCQTGPKNGTQCYSQMDLQPPGAPPPPPGDRGPRH